MAAILPKFRYAVSMLPEWMLPKGYTEAKCAPSMMIRNPENGSYVKGSPPIPNFGRSGRYKAILFDELPQWQYGGPAWNLCRSTTNVRIALGTPFGEDNQFAYLAQDPDALNIDYDESQLGEIIEMPDGESRQNYKHRIYTFPHYLDPYKDKAWFDAAKAGMTADAFAAEVLISYSKSRSGTVFNEFCEDHIMEDFKFNPDLRVYRALDFGHTCSAALYAQKDVHGRWMIFKEVVLNRADMSGESASTVELAKTVKRLSYEYVSHVEKPLDTCDPAGDSGHSSSETTDVRILREYDIDPQYEKIVSCRNRVAEGVSQIKVLLHERTGVNTPSIRISRKGCPTLIRAMQSGYCYKFDRATQKITDTIDERHPFEDVVDCLRYLVMQFGSETNSAQMPTLIRTVSFNPRGSGRQVIRRRF